DQLQGAGGGDNPLQPLLDQLAGLSGGAGGGDNPLQPLLDQLQGAGGGDNPLQPLLDQLQGLGGGAGAGGENPLAPYVLQLTKTVDDLLADVAGEDGTVDAVTDVVDTLVTDPAGIQASVTVIPASLQYALGRLQDNLMGFAPASGGDNPLQPLLDQLTGLGDMAGGGAGGDNPLQPLLDQLQGAGG
ncbi:hypothetical protein, partial [Spongiibacter sp. UBA6593]